MDIPNIPKRGENRSEPVSEPNRCNVCYALVDCSSTALSRERGVRCSFCEFLPANRAVNPDNDIKPMRIEHKN